MIFVNLNDMYPNDLPKQHVIRFKQLTHPSNLLDRLTYGPLQFPASLHHPDGRFLPQPGIWGEYSGFGPKYIARNPLFGQHAVSNCSTQKYDLCELLLIIHRLQSFLVMSDINMLKFILAS